jgi:hypothetical protein
MHPKGYITLSRSRRPELFPAVHGVCGTSDPEIEEGYAKHVEIVGGDRSTDGLAT